MADIDLSQLLNGLDSSIQTALGGYAYGGGSRAFSVVIQDKEVKESLKKAGEQLLLNNERLRKTREEIEENNKLSEEEIKQRKESISQAKKTYEQQEIILGYMKKAVEFISSVAGFATERAKIENDIYKAMNETGFQLKQGTKEIGSYATQLGLNVEAFTKFVSQNSEELNIIQNQFGDAVGAVSLNWTKIAKETGASNEEQRKALSTYMKLVTTTGQIGQETQQSFQENAASFIGNIKALSKSLGVNTDTILKNIESNEKQWEWQALMANEKTRDTALALQARGASLDQIIYTTTGKMSEQMALELVNPLKNYIVQGDREAYLQGRLSSADDFRARGEELKNDATARELYNQNYQAHQDINNTMLGATSKELNTIMGYGADAEYQKAISMGNTPQRPDEKNLIGTQSGVELSRAERENEYYKMWAMGPENLSEVNQFTQKTNQTVSNIYRSLGELIPKGALANLAKAGTIWENGGKQLASGAMRLGELGLSLRRNHLLAQIAGNTNETSMVKWAGKLLKGKLSTVAKVGAKAGAAYMIGSNTAHLAEKYGSQAGTGIAYGIHRLGIGIKDMFGGYDSEEEHQKAIESARRRKDYFMKKANDTVASKYMPGSTLVDNYLAKPITGQMNYNTPQTSKLKSNNLPPSDNIQNSKPQKVEIVNPTSTNNSTTDNTASIEELVNVNGKLTQLVDLFADVKSNISQLASKMPMNNYGS